MCLYARTTPFDYCSFMVSFETRKCESSKFVLQFQGCFGYLGSLEIPYEFFKNLLLAALGLCCCARAFSSCRERGLLFVVVRWLLIAVASLVVEHRL